KLIQRSLIPRPRALLRAKRLQACTPLPALTLCTSAQRSLLRTPDLASTLLFI
ncbi:hypothetical protein LPJ66_004631, partial [Kickxella alabastrina]